MITTLWDFFLFVIGTGAFICIPLLLLTIIGMFITIAIRSITPSQAFSKPKAYVAYTDNRPVSKGNWLAWKGKSLSPDNFMALRKQETLSESDPNNFQFSTQAVINTNEGMPTALQSTLRWIGIILIYAVAFGLSVTVAQIGLESLQPALAIVLTVLINNMIVVISLAGMRLFITKNFTDFLTSGWLISMATSILAGVLVGIFNWIDQNRCMDPACVYYSQVIGLAVGGGVFLFFLFLVEWWAVWGEKYEAGHWLTGLTVGLGIAVLLSAIGLIHFAFILGWMVCTFIVTKGIRGDSFYERRLGGLVPMALTTGFILSALTLLIAAPGCLCIDNLDALVWRWWTAGALAGAVSGVTCLYLWQVSPLNAKAVTPFQTYF